MLKIIVIVAAMAILVLADGSILKTGQTQSYDVDGSIVTDGSIKDDGYYRAGAVRSYSRSGDVVIDNTTGLEWHDTGDAGSAKRTWADALSYCVNIPHFVGKEWRLPTIEELQTLVDYGQYDPSATEGIFNYISSDYYWSSTVKANDTWFPWNVTFYDGISYFNARDAEHYVRCVRSDIQIVFPLIRIGEIVLDIGTGLQWQDDIVVKTIERAWTAGIDYCENTLTLGGHSDWRLPNINELLSIVDYQYEPAITSVFQNTVSGTSSFFWSSTTNAFYVGEAWVVYLDWGSTVFGEKSHDHYLRCVRGGQVNIPINPSIIIYLLN